MRLPLAPKELEVLGKGFGEEPFCQKGFSPIVSTPPFVTADIRQVRKGERELPIQTQKTGSQVPVFCQSLL